MFTFPFAAVGVRQRVLYAIFLAAPIVWSSLEAPRYAYWLLSSLGFAACISAIAGRSRRSRCFAGALAGATVFGNAPLLASLYVQRTGFNERFFAHADPSTLAISFDVYPAEVAFLACYWVAAALLPLWMRPLPAVLVRDPRVPALVAACGALVGVLAHAPAHSLVHALAERARAAEAPLLALASAPAPAAPAAGAPSLLLVVAESLEATFSDPALVGRDFTPELTALARDAVRFTGVVEVPEASWTMGGLVASQCGFPLALGPEWHDRAEIDRMPSDPRNTLAAAVPPLFPGHACLGDVLVGAGYRTRFLGGAPLYFAGKGAFLASHGFPDPQGWAALRPRLSDPDRHGPWGIHDDELFALALDELTELSAGDLPYALVVLTVDTHDLSGSGVSPACGRVPVLGRARFVLGCADRLTARFVAEARRRYPALVVALMSDHLAFPNSITDTIDDPSRRRLRFAVWAPGVAPREVDHAGTHFDIAPTILDYLGFDVADVFGLGVSLRDGESPWLSQPDRARLRVAPPVLPIAVGPGERVVFDPVGPAVVVEGRRLRANHRGRPLDGAVFALRFRDDGAFDRVLPWQRYPDLVRRESGRLVVGLSARPGFSDALGAPRDAPLVYFAGRVGAGGDFRVGVVDGAVELVLPGSFFRRAR